MSESELCGCAVCERNRAGHSGDISETAPRHPLDKVGSEEGASPSPRKSKELRTEIYKAMNKNVQGAVKRKRLTTLGLATLVYLSNNTLPAFAQKAPGTPARANVTKAQPNVTAQRPGVDYQEDILLVMPGSGSEQEKIDKAMKDAHGTVLGSIGEDDLKCLIVKTEKNKLLETEKKLSKDAKNFSYVGKNHYYSRKVAKVTPLDARFSEQWGITQMHFPEAWASGANGGKTCIAVFDTGCQLSNPDLNGKMYYGFNATGYAEELMKKDPDLVEGDIFGAEEAEKCGAACADVDAVDSHGTACATIAAASGNEFGTIGAAPGATIYPIQIANPVTLTASDLSIAAGILRCKRRKIKVISMSFNGVPPQDSVANPGNKFLQKYFRDYFFKVGGLLFVCAGNEKTEDPAPRSAFVNIVSALNKSMKKASFSNFGSAVSFTAPGQDIA
ncbi:MAG: S8 family serine peptidase, partial [Cyanobacteria bacterium]|nr:S8 family serine peptidase [Cyanobacteriota bacterium]